MKKIREKKVREKKVREKKERVKKINLPKLDLNNKRNNIIVTSVIGVLALVVTIVTGVQFTRFRNFNAEFYTGNVDEIQSYSKYSKYLAGTSGDAPIYIFYGDNNTVAVVRASDADKYDTIDKVLEADARVVKGGVVNIDKEELDISAIAKADAATAIDEVKNGTSDIAIVTYADYRAVRDTYTDLTVAKAEIEAVPSILVMGGTHPNEPAGQLAATMFLENAKVKRGVLYVVNEVNRSAYTHSQPQEATSWYYELQTASGQTRTFKYGSRATNTVDQWPTPDVYTHSSGQQLSSSEVRNINRSYPGDEKGTYTEKLSYAITQLVLQNDITMVVDLHEASPEYITINAIVAHDDALELASDAKMWTLDDVMNIGVEVSPATLHGLTHRDLGDYTYAYVFLAETSNASQGKLRGKFSPDLITYKEKDKFYEYAKEYDEKHGTKLLYAPAADIDERVARHTFTVSALIKSFNDMGCVSRTVNVGKIGEREGRYLGKLEIEMVPGYEDIMDNGVGYYLHDLD